MSVSSFEFPKLEGTEFNTKLKGTEFSTAVAVLFAIYILIQLTAGMSA
jgi:hypothetical protein